jgi:hypothetical protein
MTLLATLASGLEQGLTRRSPAKTKGCDMKGGWQAQFKRLGRWQGRLLARDLDLLENDETIDLKVATWLRRMRAFSRSQEGTAMPVVRMLGRA